MPESIENLKSIGGDVRKGKAVPPSVIAAALGWKDTFNDREIAIEATKIKTTRGYVGLEPAVVFARVSKLNGGNALDGAALYGYHSSIRWGLLADRQGLTAFNSHWTLRDNWFSFPKIDWNELETGQSVLNAFEPEKFQEGILDRIALTRAPDAQPLQPVDDELVNRLDNWREEALRFARNEQGIDQRLQRLFAQLFVLRNIEDRHLAPQLPPLSSCLSLDNELNGNEFDRILNLAEGIVGSELFEHTHLAHLPSHVIAGIISDLYKPRHLPGRFARYNFSWIDSDVLGLAYEKYLSTILHPTPPPAQTELFLSPERGIERISVRRASGVYYTPPFLTKFLARKAVESHFAKKLAVNIPRIVDFSCGSGSFLVAAIDALLDHLKRQDAKRDWAKEIIEQGFISGMDIDENAVTVARLNLWQRLTEEPNPLPLPNLSKVVVQADGLHKDSWRNLPRTFDIVLGNPPFLATSHVPNRENLEVEFKTAAGRYDYSYLFVEQAVRVSAPSGTLAMVVPNRLFRNRNGETIRRILTEEMNLDTVVDFGSNEIFSKTSAYIGCIIANHRDLLAEPAEKVRVVDVLSLKPEFLTDVLLDAAGLMKDTTKSGLRSYWAKHPRGGTPWILLSLEEARDQIRLKDSSLPLEELAGIFQGIRTGANDIFIVSVEATDEKYTARIVNGLGDTALVERKMLELVVYGAELRRFEHVRPSKCLIYPYSLGDALSEAELRKQYPLTFKYLLSYRNILSARTSIEASGLKWYELVRRRNESWLGSPKLLIRDLAPEISFSIDSVGETYLVGGTAVVPEKEELLLPLLAYLNSRPVDVLVKRTTPQFRGNFQKFEPQHLQQIPVLRNLVEQEEGFAEKLTILAQRRLAAAAQRTDEVEQLDTAIDHAVAEEMSSQGIG